jgi:hypothetical protein
MKQLNLHDMYKKFKDCSADESDNSGSDCPPSSTI